MRIVEYSYCVRVKISIELPEELIGRLDRVDKNRRRVREHRDIEIIDRNAERLNRQALDTLEYQQLRSSAITASPH